MMKTMPGGYKVTRDIRNASKPSQLPPTIVTYDSKLALIGLLKKEFVTKVFYC